jgi:hypothetical protein
VTGVQTCALPIFCSGVLVARDVVLTAAHCVTRAPEHRVHVRAPDGRIVLIAPIGTAVHPGYDAKAVKGRRRSIDLALLHLPEPVPEPFGTAVLGSAAPAKDSVILVGGYGVLHEDQIRSTGTFRTGDLRVVEPFGASHVLVWAEGPGMVGACTGDSGGPIAQGGSVVAVVSWATGPRGRGCGAITQGILLGPERDWIDRTLAEWRRSATWR